MASIIALGGSARADAAKDAIKCKAAIIKAAAGFVQAKTKALQTCEESVVTGKRPPGTDCHADAKTAALLAKVTTKLQTAVVKACAGKDKICGTLDDASLASIGWAITTCPNFEYGTCTNTITSCSDIPTCLACISEAAVDQAITLYYGALAPTDPKSKDKTVKALNKCQVTIGKAATTFLAAKSKVLATCWGTVNKAGAGACPDAVTSAAIVKAESTNVVAIKKACAGPDEIFGTADDFTPAQIGFPATCLDLTPPGGSACGGAVSSLQELIDCVDCVTEFQVDCVDRAAVPAFVDPYPAQCNPGTPAPTPTPTPTLTPTPTPRYIDNHDGTVTDKQTGLQWEQKDNWDGTVVSGDLHDADNLYSWAGCCNGDCSTLANYCQPNAAAAATCAAGADGGTQGCSVCASGTCNVDPNSGGALTTVWDWVNQVNAATFAGHSDWRLPPEGGENIPPTGTGVDELETILLARFPCGANPCIDPIFGPTPPNRYWSATTHTGVPGEVFDVSFANDGGVYYGLKVGTLYVRAVRTSP